jgi:hypothetical protein
LSETATAAPGPLEPAMMARLELVSVHTIKTPTNVPNVERLFAQVLVSCSTEATLSDCRGQLLRVLRWSGKWESTQVHEALDLLWSNMDAPKYCFGTWS